MKVSIIIPVYNQEDLLIRALESIPKRDDIEIIVIDDGSTDKTWDNLLKYRNESDFLNLICLYNEKNMGVGYTVNKGYDNAKGEYVVLLGSDDYFIKDNFIKIMDELDGTDLVYFNLEVNSGEIWRLTKENKNGLCGSVKFMRRDYINDIRCPEIRQGEDYFFNKKLQEKEHSEKFTDLVVKHYNYPRKGSLTYIAINGE